MVLWFTTIHYMYTWCSTKYSYWWKHNCNCNWSHSTPLQCNWTSSHPALHWNWPCSQSHSTICWGNKLWSWNNSTWPYNYGNWIRAQCLWPCSEWDWEQGQFQCKVGWELVQLHYRGVDGLQLQLQLCFHQYEYLVEHQVQLWQMNSFMVILMRP
jgi:hypothetical protein